MVGRVYDLYSFKGGRKVRKSGDVGEVWSVRLGGYDWIVSFGVGGEAGEWTTLFLSKQKRRN